MYQSPIRVIEFYQFNETVINIPSIIFTCLMANLVIALPRKYAVFPFIALVLFIPYVQRIIIAGMDFDMLRILMLVGFFRIIIKKEHNLLKLIKIDKVMLIFAFSQILIYLLLRKFNPSAIVNRSGFLFNVFGLYFLLRFLIHDFEDLFFIIKAMLFLSVFVAMEMLYEQITSKNFLSMVFGGRSIIPQIRDSQIRSESVFSHPILAGSFGASLLPLSWGLWELNIKPSDRTFALTGFITSTIITFTSYSSGPILTFFAALGGIFLFLLKDHLYILKRLALLLLVILHFIMNGPVWALINKISAVSGSTSYHRFALIDQFISRFGEWFLFGTISTAHWGWGLQDVTNMYVRVGIDGGIVCLILFLLLIKLCFNNIENLLYKLKNYKNLQKFIWGLEIFLFAHLISFFGVSYFGNMIFFWYLTIVFAATCYELFIRFQCPKIKTNFRP